jgi:hypothetical protein
LQFSITAKENGVALEVAMRDAGVGDMEKRIVPGGRGA